MAATRPPTLTCAPAPNSTPLGFRINTWPLACRLPRIWLGSCPTTRFSATAAALGCTKFTVSLLAMLKLCQLIARFWLPWVMVVTAPLCAMLPLPTVTCAPLGAARAQGAYSADSADKPSTAAPFVMPLTTPLTTPFTTPRSGRVRAASGIGLRARPLRLLRPLPSLPRPRAVSAQQTQALVWWFQIRR